MFYNLAEWKAQAERWQRSQSEMEGLRAALQRSAEEKKSAHPCYNFFFKL
jgi:hypothetical protein